MKKQLCSLSIGDSEIKIKAVGFDKDGTLFNALAFWRHIDKLRRDAFIRLVGVGHEEQWESMMGFHSPNHIDYNGVLAVATTKEEVLLTAGLLYQISGWPWFECKKAAETIFVQADEQMKLEEAFVATEGVPEVFRHLKRIGCSTGIITSDTLKRTIACMKLIGVDQDLDFIVTPEVVEKGKPNPDMVHKTCELMGIQASELAIVGDSIVDVKMAKSAGAIAIGIVTHEGSREMLEKEADIVIESISQIRGV